MEDTVLIHNGLLFDGMERRDGSWSVVLRGDRIDQVLEATRVPQELIQSARARGALIDAAGCTILPGLVDLHVHFTWSGGADPVTTLRLESRQQALLRAVGYARRTLQAGITTVRDLGSLDDLAIDLAQAIEAGWIEGPRTLASGKTIIMTGGHDPFWGIMVDGPQEARKAVRRQVFQGAHVIKVSATGGVYGRPVGESVDDVELTPDELMEIVEHAHRMGRHVAAHAIGRQGIQNCIEAGVDTIEHGQFLTEDQAAAMADRGIGLVPTAFVYRRLAESPEVPAYAREKAQAVTDHHRRAVALAREHGVPIGAGTDAGSPLTPHPCLVDELRCLVDYGLTPVEALRSATSVAARILGLDDIGTLDAGRRADVVCVRGDPVDDLGALERVEAVFKDGRRFA